MRGREWMGSGRPLPMFSFETRTMACSVRSHALQRLLRSASAMPFLCQPTHRASLTAKATLTSPTGRSPQKQRGTQGRHAQFADCTSARCVGAARKKRTMPCRRVSLGGFVSGVDHLQLSTPSQSVEEDGLYDPCSLLSLASRVALIFFYRDLRSCQRTLAQALHAKGPLPV